MNDLFASLGFQVFAPTYKEEPTFYWKTDDKKDPFANQLDYIKFEQTEAKEMLKHEISEVQLNMYNTSVPEPFRILRPNVSSYTYGEFIKELYTLAKRTNLTKFNDISTTFNHLSKVRDELWKEGRDTDPLTNNEALSAFKNNSGAGPNKVSPINLNNERYWASYMISLLQCLILAKAIYKGLIQVNNKFLAIGHLLCFGSGGFRSQMIFDDPSIFYLPRRSTQYDMLKQFDFLFLTVDTLSYTLIFSQIVAPLIILYLYFVFGFDALSTSAIQSQLLITIVEFKIIQEAMLALKFIFSYELSINFTHFVRSVAGEIHNCKMAPIWLLLPGITTAIVILSYCLCIVLSMNQVEQLEHNVARRRGTLGNPVIQQPNYMPVNP